MAWRRAQLDARAAFARRRRAARCDVVAARTSPDDGVGRRWLRSDGADGCPATRCRPRRRRPRDRGRPLCTLCRTPGREIARSARRRSSASTRLRLSRGSRAIERDDRAAAASRPDSIDAASRVRGVTPAALTAILASPATARRVTEDEARAGSRDAIATGALPLIERFVPICWSRRTPAESDRAIDRGDDLEAPHRSIRCS